METITISKKGVIVGLFIGLLVLSSILIPVVVAWWWPDKRPPKKVKDLVVTAVPEENALQLDWDESNARDLDHYNVYRSTTPGFTPDLETPYATSEINFYLDTAVTVGVTYYYRVSAVDTSGNIGDPSDEASGILENDTTPPEKVVGLTITVIPTGNALDLNWVTSAASDLDHYNVYRSTISGFTPDPSSLIASPTANNYLDAYLLDGTPYYYRVSAVDNSSNEGPASDESAGVPMDTVPPEKVNGLIVAVVNATGDQLDLSWDFSTAPDLDHYNVYRNTSSGFIPDPSNLIATPIMNYYLDIGLTEGVTYYYRVSALDEVPNEGPASDEASGIPGLDTTPPAKVVGLTITMVPTGNALDLNWVASTASDLDHYNVYRSLFSGFIPDPSNLIASPITNSYLDDGLTDGTVYYYRVSAVDESSNEGAPSNEGAGVPQDCVPPEQVTGLTVSILNATGDQLFLEWDPSMAPDIFQYNIYRSTTPGFTPSPLNLIATTSWNYYLDTGLTEGVTYYYRVSALDEVPNEGLASVEASGTP